MEIGIFEKRIALSEKKPPIRSLPLLHGNKKKETEAETEKLIYYDFRRFLDCSKK